MLAMPWPTSSTLDLWRLPIMPSATTAESSDSIAASSATVTADGNSSRTRSSEMAGRLGAGIEAWISPKREPIVSTGSPSAATAADAARIATIGRRHLARDLRPEQQDRERPGGDADRGQRRGAEVRGVRLPLREEVRGHRAHLQAEQVLDLRREDDDRDPAREAGDDRVRDELDRAAEPGEAEDDQHAAREDRDDRQAVEAVPRDDAVDDDDEGARRPADLDAAAAEQRDQEPGDDGGDEALFRGHAGGDREGDRERDRHDPDDDAGLEVREELGARVPAQDREGLREPGRRHGRMLQVAGSGTRARRLAAVDVADLRDEGRDGNPDEQERHHEALAPEIALVPEQDRLRAAPCGRS